MLKSCAHCTYRRITASSSSRPSLQQRESYCVIGNNVERHGIGTSRKKFWTQRPMNHWKLETHAVSNNHELESQVLVSWSSMRRLKHQLFAKWKIASTKTGIRLDVANDVFCACTSPLLWCATSSLCPNCAGHASFNEHEHVDCAFTRLQFRTMGR
jgi:hypothetical protein